MRMSHLRRDPNASGVGAGLWLRAPRWRDFDWHILAIAAVIFGTGLVFIQAISGAEHVPGRQVVEFVGHMEKVAVAVPCFLLALFLRPRWLRRNAWLLYGLCLALVVLVPIIGVERNNAKRWIELPFFDLQPSELVKLGVILILARVLQSNDFKSTRCMCSKPHSDSDDPGVLFDGRLHTSTSDSNDLNRGQFN